MALPNTNPTYEYIGGEMADGTVIGQTSASLQSFWGAAPSRVQPPRPSLPRRS